jgi:O-antigen ligase
MSDARYSQRALIIPGAMLVTLPLVAWQGPAHTTLMDGVNLLFLVCTWTLILARHESITFPLILPFWLIMIGSLGGIYFAPGRIAALITMVEDLYLFVLFLTLVHFMSRRCRVESVVTLWSAVASGVAGLTLLDVFTGVFNGALSGAHRAAGTFENPNMFGSYLLISFFLTWALAAANRPRQYWAMLVLGMAILATHSNGALVSLLGGITIAIVAKPQWFTARRVGLILAAAGIGLFVVGLFHDQMAALFVQIVSRGRDSVGGAMNKGFAERMGVWAELFQVLRRYPLGVGPGNFYMVSGTVSGTYYTAHDEYLGMLAERGPIGLIGWLSLLASVWLLIRRVSRQMPEGFRVFAREPLYGLAAAITLHAVVIEESHFRHFWLMLAVLFAAAIQAKSSAATATTPRSLREAA